MRAGLLWFTRGFIEYQFPNNATLADGTVAGSTLALKLQPQFQVPAKVLPSDITGRELRHAKYLDGSCRLRRQARQAYA